MANSPSALKRVRQTKTRTERNRVLFSRIKTLRKGAISAATEGNKEESTKLFSAFTSSVDKAAKNSIIHKNTAANLKSRTNTSIKSALA